LSNEALIEKLTKCMKDNEEKLVKLLKDLVSFPNESQDPQNKDIKKQSYDCLNYISKWLEAYGFKSEIWEETTILHGMLPHMVSKRLSNGGGRSLAFNGHIDVVPAGDRTKWKYDPFAGNVTDRTFTGRGASDMKGGIAASMMAVSLLEECGIKIDGNVEFHFVSDEEIVGIGTRKIIEKYSDYDAVIGTEPTGLNISPFAPGLEHLRIEVEGRSQHAGMRYAEIYDEYEGESRNAIEKALKILNAIQALERKWGGEKEHPMFPKGFNTILPGLIIGGSGGGKDGMLNSIVNPGTTPDYCSLEYNIWFYPGETLESIRKEIEDCIQKVVMADDWLRVHPPKLTWSLRGITFPPLNTSADHELVAILGKAASEAGCKTSVQAFEAAADLSWYSEKNIPAVLFGPGEMVFAHSPNECISIDSLCKGAVTLAATLVRWCNTKK
jgi:acetylornithine deacetylase/succinyl-diaminopimelate desuccinylase family protein